MNVRFSFKREIDADAEASLHGFDFHAGGNVGGGQGFQQTKIPNTPCIKSKAWACAQYSRFYYGVCIFKNMFWVL